MPASKLLALAAQANLGNPVSLANLVTQATVLADPVALATVALVGAVVPVALATAVPAGDVLRCALRWNVSPATCVASVSSAAPSSSSALLKKPS